jgi:hypothetical protein
MPDSSNSDASDAALPSRRGRLESRRRRKRWTVIAVLAISLGAAGAIVAFTSTDDVNASGSGALSNAAVIGNQPSPSSTASKATIKVRPLSHDEPLRLWVGGDSLSGALGPALGTLAGNTGIVDTYVDYKVSSGLTPSTRDWQSYATELLAQRDPEAVVFMIGTNDVNVVNSLDANDDGIPDWEVDYRARVEKMMDLLIGGSKQRTVIWIGAPTLRDEQRDADAVKVNAIMREEAAKRSANVTYFDAYKLFGDEEGKFSSSLDIPVTNKDGTTDTESVRVRVGDGIHLTPAGAEYLAKPVFALLDARFHLAQQADRAHPISVTIATGGELGSGSSGSGSSSSSDSGSGSSSTKRRRSHSSGSSNNGSSNGDNTPTTEGVTQSPQTDPPPISPPVTTPVTSPATTPPVTDPPIGPGTVGP